MMFPIVLLLAATPLFKAIQEKRADQVTALLERDPALANQKNEKGVSPTIAAMSLRNGDVFLRPQDNAVLKAVLAAKPKPDVFEEAALGNATALAARLDEDKTLVQAWHSSGWTLLHFAAFGGNVNTAALLIDRGAEIEARAKNKFENTPLQVAGLTGQVEMSALLIKKGADVRASYEHGVTALHLAAELGSVDLLKILLDAGADVNAKMEDGTTALDIALKSKHEKAAAFLKLNAKAATTNTPAGEKPTR